MIAIRVALGLGVAVAAAVGTITLLATAAPFVPPQVALPAELLSMAQLERVRVEVSELPDIFEKAGLTRDKVVQTLRVELRGAGVAVEDDPDLPRLVVTLASLRDGAQPDAVGVYIVFGLHQAVTLHRLGRDMVVPTATLATGRLTSRAHLATTLRRELDQMVQRLTRSIRQASASESDRTM